MDEVTLGGCRQFGNYNNEIDPQDSKAIWQRATQLLPHLKKAKMVKEAVGLRPYRGQIRVEKERVHPNLTVIHHYGHGGWGVMLSPGTSVTVSKLVGQVLLE